MSPSIARNSLARLASDGSHLFFGFLSGVITARWFEPAGKGAYAALVSLVSLAATASTLGLGDAGVILIGSRRVTLERFASVVVVPVLVASVVGGVAVAVISQFQLADEGPTLGRAVLVAALSVPVVASLYLFSLLASAYERIVVTSVIRAVVHGLSLVGIVLLVVVVNLHITGGLLGGLIGSAGGLIAVVVVLRRMGASLRPSWDTSLLREALKLGIVIELAHSMLTLSARVDVLFVYSLVGRAEAGQYSVALTMGQLVAFASLALSFALFPRVASLDDSGGLLLVARASRVGIATSLISGAILLVVIPLVTPLAFGPGYTRSIAPALVLLIGAAFWAEQNLLARARTAQGNTRLQLWSYGTTLVVMVILDLLLIPPLGALGAALASAASAACGLIICGLAYRSPAREQGIGLREFVPAADDFRFLARSLRELSRGLVTREA